MTFPAGLPAHKHLERDGEDTLRVRLSSARGNKHSSNFYLSAETNLVQYDGKARKGLPVGELVVGIHSKSSGTVRLCQPSQLFVMKQTLRMPITSLETDADVSENITGKRDLAQELGSEKSRKKMKASAATYVDVNRIKNRSQLSQDIDAAFESAAPESELQSDADSRPLLPPFNAEATTARDTYPRDGIIPEKVWNAIDVDELAAAILNPVKMKALREHPRIWPPFLLDLSRTVDVKSEDLKLVYYLVCMVRYIRANNAIYKDNSMHSRHKCDEQIETPFMIWNHLVGEYSTAKAQSRARRITREDQHKVMIHFTALLLHTCRGSVFSSDLASVLNIDGDRSQMYLRQLGCVLAPTKLGQSGRQAVLQLPLKLPSLGERKRPK